MSQANRSPEAFDVVGPAIVCQSSYGPPVTASVQASSKAALADYVKDTYAFDLAVLDQTMPEMTGFELGQELIRFRPDMPVILLTGFSKLVNEKTAKRAGFREYFSKPLVDERLENAVVRILTSD